MKCYADAKRYVEAGMSWESLEVLGLASPPPSPFTKELERRKKEKK